MDTKIHLPDLFRKDLHKFPPGFLSEFTKLLPNFVTNKRLMKNTLIYITMICYIIYGHIQFHIQK